MIASNRAHSADVPLWLDFDGKRYELRHIGPDFVILAKTQAIVAGEAIVETIIDGQSQRWPVGHLPEQAPGSKRINFPPLRS